MNKPRATWQGSEAKAALFMVPVEVADGVPEWWVKLHTQDAPPLLNHRDGYSCPVCGRKFTVRLDARNRRNLGFLKASAIRHQHKCWEIEKVSKEAGVSREEAEALIAKWSRLQNRHRKAQKEAVHKRLTTALAPTE